MKTSLFRILISLTLMTTMAFGLSLGVGPTPRVLAATVITVTPVTSSWFFTDDGFPGGIGELIAGPGTPPLGSGSVHLALPGVVNAREAYGTVAHAGTRLDQITTLQYSTYRGSVDAGNNLAIALQFDMDYNLTDAITSWQGRLVYEPYFSFPGGVLQNTWQTWNPLAGKWWASGAPGNSVCPQSAPCTWAQVLAAFPNAGLRAGVGMTWLKAGGPANGFDGNADALTIGVSGSDTTYDFEAGLANLFFMPTSATMAMGGAATIYINLNSISNLYGYQFQVNYDSSVVSAAPAFVNSFFNTAGGAIPTGWRLLFTGFGPVR